MCHSSDVPSKKPLNLRMRIDPALIEEIKREASEEDRSETATVERILRAHFNLKKSVVATKEGEESGNLRPYEEGK